VNEKVFQENQLVATLSSSVSDYFTYFDVPGSGTRLLSSLRMAQSKKWEDLEVIQVEKAAF
jgi:hypothetical protein